MKAIIYGWLDFPRGSATANYIQYLGLALQQIGYEVHIVSNKPVNNAGELYSLYKGMHIKYYNLNPNKLKHYIDYNFFRGNIYLKAIEELNVGENDLLISYCMNFTEFYPILVKAKKWGCKTVACITEYFQLSQIDKLNAKIQYYMGLKWCIPKHDYILPISTYIAKKYEKENCMVLPIMSDSTEYNYGGKKIIGNKIKIIYPANGRMKDSLEMMLRAFSGLDRSYMNRVELHLTATSKRLIAEYDIPKINQLIGNNIIIHDWLEYSELVNLYKSCHFMFIARENNQMTKANFPSKVPEVMTHGVVPIASVVGDYTKYYLQDGLNSIFINDHSINSCQDALIRAINMNDDSVLKMCDNARDTVIKKFDYVNWTEKLREFLLNG